MRKRLAIGAAGGIVWGVIAAVVFAAMFSGVVAAPGDVGLPIAIVVVLLYFPFIVAAGAPRPQSAEAQRRSRRSLG